MSLDSIPALLLLAAAGMAGLMALLWLHQKLRRNAGWVDVGWSAGIGLTALLFAALSTGHPARRALVGAMTGLWSLRLAWYIARRVASEPEDGRYQALRASRAPHEQAFFFWFFQFQALLVVLFAVSPLIAMRTPTGPLVWNDALAALIWLIAVVGESFADRQLAAFRRDPANRGRTCRAGLWRYSRHPNYFFEWVHWWAYVAMAIAAPVGWLTLLGPALMLFFLFKVTGIPPTEARALASRGDDYRAYQRTTSVFFPWPPKP